MLNAGADVNKKNPLLKAISKNRIDIATKLLDKGADSNIGIHLYKVIENKNIDLLQLLIKAGAETKDDLYMNLAIESGDHQIVKLVLEGGNKPNSKKNKKPIHKAIEADNFEIVKVLVEAGVDVNEMKSNGETPLYMALGKDDDFKPNIQIIDFLLENGAQSMLVGKDEVTKLANTPGKPDYQLVTVDKFKSPLFKVFGKGSPELIDKFLSKIDVTEKAINGISALHIACRSAKINVVKELIDRGMDINLKEKTGVTTFFFLGGHDVEEKITLFKENGFDINSYTMNEYNLLHVSVLDDNAEAVEGCVKAGIDIESYINSGPGEAKMNALHLACANANREATKKLIELGANLNAVYQDEHGRKYSPMQIAKGGLLSVIEKAGEKYYLN